MCLHVNQNAINNLTIGTLRDILTYLLGFWFDVQLCIDNSN